MNEKYINPFLQAFVNIMPQFGFTEISRRNASLKGRSIKSPGVIVIIGIFGAVKGNVIYAMTEEDAKKVASAMMMGMPVNELDELAQSAISELVNMLTANVATNFSLEGIQIDISTPTLMKGEFSANACTDKVISVEMAANDVVIDMNIFLENLNLQMNNFLDTH